MSKLLNLSLLLLLLVCLVHKISATEADEIEEDDSSDKLTTGRKEKVLSLFSIVQFKNSACTSTSSTNGTCYTSSECTNKGGTATGNCASGFGVCCVFTLTAAGTVNYNSTYVQNPGYPSVYSSSSSITYTVNKCSSDVCWLRLDFESFTLLGPTVSTETQGGLCTDSLKITTTATGVTIPTICGQNTGQHIYVDVGPASATASLAFTIGTGTSTSRKWSIKISQIQCSSRTSPPNGCLQYMYSPQGRIQTFNFLDSSGTSSHLASQRYQVCIRPEAGMCCVQYQVCADQSNAFTLSSGAIATGISNVAILDTLCTNDYTEIIGSSSCSNNNYLHSRYCGGIFSTDTTGSTDYISICDCTQPFRVGFVTDAVYDGATGITTGNAGTSRGNCFDYRQIPCGTTGPSS